MAKCETLSERKARREAETLSTTPAISNGTNKEAKKKKPTEPIPAFPFFISNVPGNETNRYEDKAKRHIEMQSPYDFINNYENIQLKTFKRDSEFMPFYLVNLFDHIGKFFGLSGPNRQDGWENELQYVVVGTRIDNGITETMFALPQNVERKDVNGVVVYPKDYFTQSIALEKRIISLLSGRNASDLNSFGLNKEKLLQLVTGKAPQPPMLVEQPGHRFTLAKLIENYGSAYPRLFSSPMIVTENNAKFTDPKIVGKTIILYAKHPDTQIIDDVISREGITDNSKFGYIVLNEKSIYNNLDDMLAQLSVVGEGNISHNQRRLIVSNRLIRQITTRFSMLGEKYFESMFSVKDGDYLDWEGNLIERYETTTTHYDKFLDLLYKIKGDKKLEAIMNELLADKSKGMFPDGVHISPALSSGSDLRAGVLARIDQSTDAAEKLLYENLEIHGLSEVITSVGTFPLDIKEEDYAELFATDKSGISRNVAGKIVPIVVSNPDLSQRSEEVVPGKEFKTNSSEVLEVFQFKQYGSKLPINSIDLSNFVATLTDRIMNNPSKDIGAVLTQYIQENNPC